MVFSLCVCVLCRTRGLATAISVALNYALNFVATKSYYNLEVTFSLPGVTLMNCVFAILGWIVMYVTAHSFRLKHILLIFI